MKRILSLLSLLMIAVVGMNAQNGDAASFDFTKVAITPAEGVVASLENFNITFGGQTVTVNEDALIELVNTQSGETVDGGLELDEDGSVNVGLADRVSAPGAYQLNIPSGAILFEGKAIDPLSFRYTIAGAADYTINPAEGVVSALSTFTITFNNYMVDVDNDNVVACLINKETEAEVAASVYSISGGKAVYVALDNEVMTPGEYELCIIEGLTKTIDDSAVPELYFSYTIEGAAPAGVVIDMSDAIVADEGFTKLFSSTSDLDFSAVDGIKAYVAVKNYDNYNYVESVTLSPIDVVPAGTGVVVKSEENKAYTIPVAEFVFVDEFTNDLVAVSSDLDLYDAVKTNSWGEFSSGPAVLGIRSVYNYDLNTGEYTTVDAFGFMPADKPAQAGTDYIKAGEAYLALADDEWDSWYEYIKVTFADMEVDAYNSIAELTALPLVTDEGGKPATLNMVYTAEVTWANDTYMGVQDYSGGIIMQVPTGVSVKAGDILAGSYTGSYTNPLYPTLSVSPLTNADNLMVLNGEGVPQPKSVTVEEAFESENLMRYVKLSDINLKVVAGDYGNNYWLYNADGTEVFINPAFDEAYYQLFGLADGDAVEIEGYAFIVTDGSPYLTYGYDKYEFLPVNVTKKDVSSKVLIADWQALEEGTEATLTLEDAQVNYVDAEEGLIAIQDATGGMVLYVEGLNVQQGDRLNGQLAGEKVDDEMGFFALQENDNTDVEAVEVSAGELVVKEVSIAEAKAEENRMVLVMVKDSYYSEEGYELNLSGMTISYPSIEKDDEKMMLFDGFMTDYTSELGEEYDGADVAGLPIVASVFALYGIDEAVLIPIVVPGDTYSITTGIEGAKKMIAKDGLFYNMNGLRVDNPQKGIFIQNGKKVVVK